ncbi:MAG: hypothetical protein LBH70_11010, partial [Spirochaetaceae bacterium]|nr:hypothetical protein [Spirochaetaceae bacterium]
MNWVERTRDLLYGKVAKQTPDGREGLSVFQFINSIIVEFQTCFKRHKTWEWFSRRLIGFLIRP